MKMMKLVFSVYLITLSIALLLPISSSYTTLLEKLFISQIYTIPAVLITMLIHVIFREDLYIEEGRE